jgi:hypothetical protein
MRGVFITMFQKHEGERLYSIKQFSIAAFSVQLKLDCVSPNHYEVIGVDGWGSALRLRG